MATASGLTLAATLGWAVLVLTVADHRRADRRPSVRAVLRGVLSAAPRLLRPGVLVTGLQLAVLQPLAGTTVFAPITGEVAVPPFIGREFLKAPLSAALWCSLAALVVFVSFRIVLAPAFTVVAGEGPIRGLLSSLRVTRSVGLPVAGRMTVLLVSSAIARVVVVWSSTPLVELIPSEQLRAVVDVLPVLVLSTLTVVTAQAVAFSVVATVQSARGIGSPIGERVNAPGPTTRRIVAVVMVAVVGCTALLVPSRAVSQPDGVHVD
ncbi:glycerophosphoryl diester phosphodiesterase membrane domain-containing protein [Curtobacterium sp. MCPF17_050]|uniref:glycerophosphoryl diester phosphodiesterase membrane domain-containing protein n=1 Tax=Curtobacterium sp. MCPF17_050 TaxID=2175664 RepID=UPI000D8740F7|nr:glycerophosphoryl diester phosphodiesterase membrane domain-containing protein [Curtobacterium sp. MCPF17_050]WIB15510.1 glycerophosphoryl diester phosphodiesterase membrane domain-containing protein [Curtobacterium sp. MCPF17_050]